jgi:hypothetical protein
MNLPRILAAWTALPTRIRFAVLGGIAALALGVVFLMASTGRPCGAREDVEARVAALTSAMQADAAAGKITIEELALRVKRLNAAATTFETSKDLPAFCASLDALTGEFAG